MDEAGKGTRISYDDPRTATEGEGGRRILHEEELANLSEDNKKLEAGEAAGRLSERHLKAEIERKKQALEELAEEEDWIFELHLRSLWAD